MLPQVHLAKVLDMGVTGGLGHFSLKCFYGVILVPRIVMQDGIGTELVPLKNIQVILSYSSRKELRDLSDINNELIDPARENC